MNARRFTFALISAASAVALTSCGLFGGSSKPQALTAAQVGGQEFDPYTNSWRPTQGVVTPPPSEPNAYLAQKQAEAEKENSLINRTTRAVGNTATAAGEAVKKPLKWVPFVGGGEKSQDDVDPNYYPAPAPGAGQ